MHKINKIALHSLPDSISVWGSESAHKFLRVSTDTGVL